MRAERVFIWTESYTRYNLIKHLYLETIYES